MSDIAVIFIHNTIKWVQKFKTSMFVNFITDIQYFHFIINNNKQICVQKTNPCKIL